jgi:hypothetical protein
MRRRSRHGSATPEHSIVVEELVSSDTDHGNRHASP